MTGSQLTDGADKDREYTDGQWALDWLWHDTEPREFSIPPEAAKLIRRIVHAAKEAERARAESDRKVAELARAARTARNRYEGEWTTSDEAMEAMMDAEKCLAAAIDAEAANREGGAG